MSVGTSSDFYRFLQDYTAEQAGVEKWEDIITRQYTGQYDLAKQAYKSGVETAEKQSQYDITQAYSNHVNALLASKNLTSDRYRSLIRDSSESQYLNDYETINSNLYNNISSLYSDYYKNVSDISKEEQASLEAFDKTLREDSKKLSQFMPIVWNVLAEQYGEESGWFEPIHTAKDDENSNIAEYRVGDGFDYKLTTAGENIFFTTDKEGAKTLTEEGKQLLSQALRGTTGTLFRDKLTYLDDEDLIADWDSYGKIFTDALDYGKVNSQKDYYTEIKSDERDKKVQKWAEDNPRFEKSLPYAKAGDGSELGQMGEQILNKYNGGSKSHFYKSEDFDRWKDIIKDLEIGDTFYVEENQYDKYYIIYTKDGLYEYWIE